MAINSSVTAIQRDSVTSLVEQIELTLCEINNHVERMLCLLQGPTPQEAPEPAMQERPVIDRLTAIRERADRLNRQMIELIHLTAPN